MHKIYYPIEIGNKLPMHWILNIVRHDEDFKKCVVFGQFLRAVA